MSDYIHQEIASPQAKRCKVRGDGRSNKFNEMLTVKNEKSKFYKGEPIVSADYWEVMPKVEAQLEQARIQREQAEREESYNRAINALTTVREIGKTSENTYKRKHTDTVAIDALVPTMEELYGRGMTYRQIGAALGVHASTVQKRLEKKGVA